ncbi:MAG: hypothetical protein N2662_00395, partial [Bacteroidales bacterium]|nr:hypothetical protein [Bacteroidales bacterium]
MGTKAKRLLTIKNILSTTKISTQEELLHVLSERGFSLTQATLSRDLKTLKVGKIADSEKGYVYFLPDHHDTSTGEITHSHENFPVNGFISLKFSNNLGVIRTKSGY